MQYVFMIALALHVMSGVFWAGSTFVLARTGDGRLATTLFAPQMGAATVAVLSGAVLWYLFHGGGYFGTQEQVLAIGAAAAIAAAGVQGALVGRARRIGAQGNAANILGGAVRGERLAAALLAITVITMAIARVL
ncbi:MAG TPA: hypothetical protein VGV39_25345 [Mesorhizobium sp.]|uniref:hypothetical protein n=1 Tax=Mesorhizobium sp. TaxID=1871066 RepID=UPI002DDC9846|nr:hypothetical protein [Mesorhizobium sp.]HEV2506424.1 hypothetical protein [Mesorhizobium sp.]